MSNAQLMNFNDNVTQFRQRVKDYYATQTLPIPKKLRDKPYGTALAATVGTEQWEKMFDQG